MIIGDQIALRLQNASEYCGDSPTIVIENDDIRWASALTNYKNHKLPTADSRWFSGVFLIMGKIERQDNEY